MSSLIMWLTLRRRRAAAAGAALERPAAGRGRSSRSRCAARLRRPLPRGHGLQPGDRPGRRRGPARPGRSASSSASGRRASSPPRRSPRTSCPSSSASTRRAATTSRSSSATTACGAARSRRGGRARCAPLLNVSLQLRELTPRALRTLRLLGVTHVLRAKRVRPDAPPLRAARALSRRSTCPGSRSSTTAPTRACTASRARCRGRSWSAASGWSPDADAQLDAVTSPSLRRAPRRGHRGAGRRAWPRQRRRRAAQRASRPTRTSAWSSRAQATRPRPPRPRRHVVPGLEGDGRRARGADRARRLRVPRRAVGAGEHTGRVPLRAAELADRLDHVAAVAAGPGRRRRRRPAAGAPGPAGQRRRAARRARRRAGARARRRRASVSAAAAPSRRRFVAALLYAVLAMLFVSPALVPGKTLSNSDTLWFEPPWVSAKPRGAEAPQQPRPRRRRALPAAVPAPGGGASCPTRRCGTRRSSAGARCRPTPSRRSSARTRGPPTCCRSGRRSAGSPC